jgi:hypothetical protein
MNAQLRKYAKQYSETDIEILLAGAFDMTVKVASNIAIYEHNEKAESAHSKIANADLMTAVLNVAVEDGFVAEIEGNYLVVANANKFEDKISNKFWVADHIGSELSRIAKKDTEKMVKIERVPSKYAKPSEELGWGTPGYTYCSVWRIPATHTIEIGGYVIPAYMVGYTHKIMPRNTQWGTKETSQVQHVPEKIKVSQLESVNRILQSMEKKASYSWSFGDSFYEDLREAIEQYVEEAVADGSINDIWDGVFGTEVPKDASGRMMPQDILADALYEQAEKVQTVGSLESPLDVYLDEQGWYTVEVPEHGSTVKKDIKEFWRGRGMEAKLVQKVNPIQYFKNKG